MSNLISTSRCAWQGERRDFVFCPTDCEAGSISLNSLKNGLKNKLTDMNEVIIDVFEDLIITMQEKSGELSWNKLSCGTKKNTEDCLELGLDSGKEYFTSLKQKTKTKFCENKNKVIDGFEELVEKIREMGHLVYDPLQTVHLWKERTVDDFEKLLEQINNKMRGLKKKCHYFIKDKGICVIDEFEGIVESTKWEIEDKKLTLLEGAVNIFDDILEVADEVIEEGEEEVKAELDSVNYALWFGEKLLSEFLKYCEQFTSEFVKSSEKQVIYLLCEGKKKAKVFYTEVVDSLVRGYEDKLLCDNLVLEINSSRYAYNVSMSEVNFHVVRALLTLPRPDESLWQQLVSRLSYFMPILTNYIRSAAAQRDCLLAIEDVAGTHPEIFDVLVKIIHWLYEQDILSEEAIFHWYNHPCSEPDLSNAKRVRNQVAPFIKWLKEAEEQSSDDEDTD